MLRKLRHKFIATAMCSIAAVLLLIMSAINIANYVNVCDRADSRITQKRFITDASHKIKTPLTIIDANTEVLKMTGGENQWQKVSESRLQD